MIMYKKANLKSGRSSFGSRKGNLAIDSIILIVFLFVMSITAFIGYMIINEMNDEVQSGDEFSATAKAESADLNVDYPLIVDAMFITALVSFWILIIVTTFLIDTHPIFFVLTLFLMLFTLIFSVYMGDAYTELSEQDGISATVAVYPMMHFVQSNIIMFIIGIAFTALITTFAKSRI